jgi:hypothetical protein
VIHDPALLDQLDALPKESFEGQVYRATRLSLDPLAASYNGGRWMARDVAAILYTSLEREGALAEIAFHCSQPNSCSHSGAVITNPNVENTIAAVASDSSAR